MKISKQTKLIFILFLLTLSECESKYRAMKKPAEHTDKEEDKDKEIEAQAVQIVQKTKDKFKAVMDKIGKSKVFNFLMGAIMKIVRSSGNPVVECVVCVIDSIKLYKKLKKEKEEKGKSITREELLEKEEEAEAKAPDAAGAGAAATAADISPEDMTEEEWKKYEQSTASVKTEDLLKENADAFEGLDKDDSSDAKLFSSDDVDFDSDVEKVKEDIKTVDPDFDKDDNPGDTKVEEKKKKKKGLFTKLAVGTVKAGLNAYKMAKKFGGKVKKAFIKLKQKLSSFFGKVLAAVEKIIKTPLFQALKEFFICVIPQVMTIALDNMSVFASFMSGGFVLTILKSSPKWFSTIIKTIRSVWRTKKNTKLTPQQKFENWGGNLADIILLVMNSIIGKTSTPCPKVDTAVKSAKFY